MIQLAWLIPILPLIGFLVIGLGGKKLSKKLSLCQLFKCANGTHFPPWLSSLFILL